uniref:F-box domain-containing protein n=1 Tax=Kalanchoe fedtschenkoi TaxID=63787 RepID=A0A7N0TUZ9_KALFE
MRMMMLSSEICGAGLLLAVPDDVFAIISRSLTPRDVCNLSMCCRSLYDLAASDKIWLTQCQMLGLLPSQDLLDWRNGVVSYKALYRFLVSVRPLIGIWVHQNPELGNVVYVMPGFVSVVGCRIIPQELGPLGIQDGPILWAPVFEIVGDCGGSAAFLLHGTDKEDDYLYPGSVKSIEKTCNVLLLEVEPSRDKSQSKLIHSKSFVHHPEQPRKISRSDQGLSKSQRVGVQNALTVPFGCLAFGDRRKLLELITSRVGQKVPDSAKGPLFLPSRNDEESFKQNLAHLIERRSLLLKIYKVGTGQIDGKSGVVLPSDPTQLELSEIRKSLDRASGFRSSLNGDDVRAQTSKRKTLGCYFRNSVKQILGKSSSLNISNGNQRNGYIGSENKHAQLNEFLRSGDTIGLTIHASTMKLTSYRAWPNMHDSRFALYKLPMQVPTPGREYAGLWGGTFGWPPGKPTEDKPGKALFFLLISYEESQGQLVLIATKILEGTNYVLHPNGSAMFIVHINEPSYDTFPWMADGDLLPINVKHVFAGEGIANGYGFRYPGSKPGSLFVIQDGLLAFIWKESRAVLTLQRLNLQDLIRKGERVPALPPIANFSYLTKSYSNVFAGFANTSNCLSSPRNNRL